MKHNKVRKEQEDIHFTQNPKQSQRYKPLKDRLRTGTYVYIPKTKFNQRKVNIIDVSGSGDATWFGIYSIEFNNLNILINNLDKFDSPNEKCCSTLKNIRSSLNFFLDKIDKINYEYALDACLIIHDSILRKNISKLSAMQIKALCNSLRTIISKNCTKEDCSSIIKYLIANDIHWIMGDNNINDAESFIRDNYLYR